MPPEDGPAEWRPGCPDCAHLREELATAEAQRDLARESTARYRDYLAARDDKLRASAAELLTVRAEMRAAVVAYEAQLRVQGEYHVALVDGLRHVLDAASDPMDVYTSPGPRP